MMATERWFHPESRLPKSNWHRFTISTLGELPAVLDTVEAELQAAGISLKAQFAIRLSLEEAVANAIRHGHRGDASLPVRICWCLTANRWLAEVIDRGRGFDVSSVLGQSAALGRGIGLMRRYLNWVRYNYLGNRVVLCKYLAPRVHQ